jgi:uncharacterized YigZ family protein
MTTRYLIPAAPVRIETEVLRSRFIASLSPAGTVEAARGFVAACRAEMPDANHHVYAFKVGYGASVIEGVSDDGEPTGTAGPPILAILRGTDVGDVALVVTRYFGGTKLGTGGLVRAYSDAAHAAIDAMTTHEKVARQSIGFTLPYSLYERVKRMLSTYEAALDDEIFEGDITLYLTLPVEQIEPFSVAIRELSAGRVIPTVL